VFVMTPPVFAVLSVLPYCLLRRVPFVMDAHTAAFLHPRWKHWQWLQRWLSRRAATTIVTNEHLANLVRQGGGHATIVRDVPVEYPPAPPFPLNGKFAIAAVCSFNYDEPVEEIFKAAEKLENVEFYVTGNTRDLSPEIAARAPGNVRFTGFLPDPDYGSLLKTAQAVLTLTTRDHTMLRGAYEAIYLGTPVIISDWPILREAFPRGAVYVDNTMESIVRAVREMAANQAKLQQQALALRKQKLAEWKKTKAAILQRIRTQQNP
ncbi:MAG: glycosyltransferase, partial [Calditrichaeota bacterium]